MGKNISKDVSESQDFVQISIVDYAQGKKQTKKNSLSFFSSLFLFFTIKVPVEVPAGRIVCVECVVLCFVDGGLYAYAFLVRSFDFPRKNVTSPLPFSRAAASPWLWGFPFLTPRKASDGLRPTLLNVSLLLLPSGCVIRPCLSPVLLVEGGTSY